jgi:hypothetical protein
VTFGCEENNNGGLNHVVPDKAKEVNCTAGWVDQSNVKTQSASCAIGGSTVTASGTVRGRDRECIVSDILSGGVFRAVVGRKTACNCPGGGHASLQLEGSYKVSETLETAFKDGTIAPHRFIESYDNSMPSDSTRQIQAIEMDVRRPRCDKPLDTIVMKFPIEPTAIVTQNSQNGLFKATFRNERLRIEKAQ